MWGDGGWGQLVRDGKQSSTVGSTTRLVEALAELVRGVGPVPRPGVGDVCSIAPSSRARRLPSPSGWPPRSVCRSSGRRPARRTATAEAAAELRRTSSAMSRVRSVSRRRCVGGPVLLVDDVVDSGWTLTEIGRAPRTGRGRPGLPCGAGLVGRTRLMNHSPDSIRAALLLTNRLVPLDAQPLTAREFWQLVEQVDPGGPRCTSTRRRSPSGPVSTSAGSGPASGAARCRHGAELRAGASARRGRLADLGARRPVSPTGCANGSVQRVRRSCWWPDRTNRSSGLASESSARATPTSRRPRPLPARPPSSLSRTGGLVVSGLARGVDQVAMAAAHRSRRSSDRGAG